jgi:hypothetical protein
MRNGRRRKFAESTAGEEGGCSPNSDDRKKSLALCLLCDPPSSPLPERALTELLTPS